MRHRSVVKNYFVREPETQLFTNKKVEVSGFIPRSVQIQKMFIQGELDKAMLDFENNKIVGRSNDDLEKRIGLLNIKGLTRSELIKRVRSMNEELLSGFNDYEKKLISLYDKLQGSTPLDASNAANSSDTQINQTE